MKRVEVFRAPEVLESPLPRLSVAERDSVESFTVHWAYTRAGAHLPGIVFEFTVGGICGLEWASKLQDWRVYLGF